VLLQIADQLAQRKLSLNTAAKKAGMAEDRLRAVAEGAEPSLHELRQIAAALRVPLSALTRQDQSGPVQMLFRKNINRRPTAESLVEELLSSHLNSVRQLVTDLPSNLKWLKVFGDLDPLPRNAERFANRFREHFFNNEQLEPFLELPELVARKLGVFVVCVDNQETEGASAVIDRHAYVLLSRRTFKPRMLFTLAHEVGHLVAHGSKNGAGEFALFDKVTAVGSFRRPQRVEEKFADAFASALLMPQETVLQLIAQVRKQYQLSGPLGDIEINFVARFFGVSFEVAGRKCEDLGLLPVGGAYALYEQLIDDHSNPERRASDAGLPGRQPIFFDISPALLRAGVRKILAGEASIGKVAEALHIPVSALVAANAEGHE
jgi:Zn-dependent peptidase ImmA (M78 family)